MVTPVCLDTLGLGALLAICSELRLHRVTSLLEKIGLWVGLPLLVGLKIMANFARSLGSGV